MVRMVHTQAQVGLFLYNEKWAVLGRFEEDCLDWAFLGRVSQINMDHDEDRIRAIGLMEIVF